MNVACLITTGAVVTEAENVGTDASTTVAGVLHVVLKCHLPLLPTSLIARF